MDSVRQFPRTVKGFSMVPHELLSDGRLTPIDKLVASALPYWAHQKGECYPSNATIGGHVKLSERAISRSLATLQKYRWVELLTDCSVASQRMILILWKFENDTIQASRVDQPGEGGWTGQSTKEEGVNNKRAFVENGWGESHEPSPGKRLTVDERMSLWDSLKGCQGIDDGPEPEAEYEFERELSLETGLCHQPLAHADRDESVPWQLRSYNTVTPCVMKAVWKRQDDGLSEAENRAATAEACETTCREYGITGDALGRYRSWVADAVECVFTPGHKPTSRPYDAVIDVGIMPCLAVV